ncbi:MAG: tetratricopeptide repeat protein [Pseudomonadota bacterium]
MKANDIPQAIQTALAHHQSGKLVEAIEIYRQILAVTPNDAGILNLLGLALYQQGKFIEAVGLIKQAIALNPGEVAFRFNLGNVLKSSGDFAQAEQHYRQALAMQPAHFEAAQNLVNLLESQGRDDDAAALCREALRYNAGSVALLYKLGGLLQKRGSLGEAATCYQRVLDLRPAALEARFQLAYVLHLLGRLDQAVPHYRQVLAARPQHGATHMYLGRALAGLNQAGLAIEHCEKAVQLMPQHADAHRNLGSVMLMLGRREEAAQAYRRALELKPDDVNARHMLNSIENVTPERADADYVRELFDDYAGKFESHLQNDLKYDVPYKLRELLGGQFPERKFESMLDMGCGTGLSGVPMRDLVRRMAGVDLSEKMLEQARQKQVYDELHAADLIGYLKQSGDAAFDLLLSADVFIYLGDLAPVFAEARRVLQAGGILAYSTEAADGGEVGELGYKLETSGRYVHHAGYLRGLGERHGFRELHFSPTTVRTNLNKPVPGYIVLLERI